MRVDILVINLDHSRHRLEQFEALNGHLKPHLKRFSAVEGKAMGRRALVERGVIATDLSYSDGALGNALSHIARWDRAIAENRPLTICEDDAIFNRDFLDAASALLAQLPADWHLMLWGWNFDSILWFDMIPGVSSAIGNFDQASLRNGIAAFQSARLAPHPFRLLQAFGTVGYTVSVAGAQRLKHLCLPIRDMDIKIPGLQRILPNRDIGVLLNAVYSQMNAFVSLPPLVVTPNDHAVSTIQTPVRES